MSVCVCVVCVGQTTGVLAQIQWNTVVRLFGSACYFFSRLFHLFQVSSCVPDVLLFFRPAVFALLSFLVDLNGNGSRFQPIIRPFLFGLLLFLEHGNTSHLIGDILFNHPGGLE